MFIIVKYLVISGYNWQVCEQVGSHYKAIIGESFTTKEDAKLWIKKIEQSK